MRRYRLMLLQIKNVAAASNAALQHDVASLKRETEEMQSKLERSLQSFDTVQQEAQAVEGEVVDEVCLLTLCLFSQTCIWQHFTIVSVVCGNKASCVYAVCDPLVCAALSKPWRADMAQCNWSIAVVQHRQIHVAVLMHQSAHWCLFACHSS
jgi:hypothetical protein